MLKAHIIFTFLALLSISGIECHSKRDLLINKSAKKLFKHGDIPPVFKKLSEEFDLPAIAKGTEQSSKLKLPQSLVLCSTCAIAADKALEILNDPDISNEVFFDTIIEYCVDLGIGTQELCAGMVNQAEPEIIYILENTETNGKDLCGMVLTGLGCKSDMDSRKWEVTLPDSPKPEVDVTPYPPITDDLPILKILHLADIHYDPDYEVGSNAVCDETYLCCQSMSTGNRTEGDEAGYWGDYRACDIPRWTVEAILEDAANKYGDEIDLIFWTGDHIAHNVWSNSRDGNLLLFNETFEMILKYFPNTQLYPGIGNHEGHPVNTFAQPYVDEPDFDISWLYDELAVMWQTWLPAENSKTMAYGGYYSVPVPTQPNLRVISINSNYCYGYNWWLVMDSNDVAENLLFLVDELEKAEQAGERVYILAHMSAGNKDCEPTWSHQFNRITSRYENTIVGIFHGHTHNDHYELYFDPEDKDRVYEIGYISPSQTTFTGMNPAYKVHITEGNFKGSQYRVLDQVTYVMDLEEANKDTENVPVMEKLYSFLDDYGLKDMSPASMLNLVETMKDDDSTFDKYFWNYNHGNGLNVDEGCDRNCKEEMLCDILVSDTSDHSKC